jgi:hypothetical protein
VGEFVAGHDFGIPNMKRRACLQGHAAEYSL